MVPILAFGFSDVGGGEVMLIGLIALLLFGKSLPSVARNVGKQYHSFKRLITDASSEIRREMDAAADSLDKVAEETKKAADLLGLLQHNPIDWFKGQMPRGVGAVYAGITPASREAEAIDTQIAARADAKARRDFGEADRIRDALKAEGVLLEDGPEGTTWRRA